MRQTKIPSTMYTSWRIQRARRAFNSVCYALRKVNVAGALTTEEQLYVTKKIAALGLILGVECPNMVPKGKK